MSVTFEPAKLTHVGPIASNMRAMDRIECEAMGRTPKIALRTGLRLSQDAWTVMADGKPCAMMGVVSDGLLTRSAQVWFLGTDECFAHARDLMVYGPMFIERWLRPFDRLHNLVAVDNAMAIRMAKRWGFEFGDKREIYRGVEFMPLWVARSQKDAEHQFDSMGDHSECGSERMNDACGN